MAHTINKPFLSVTIYFFLILSSFFVLPVGSAVFADDDIEVEGRIEEIGDDYLIVQSTQFFTDSSTEFRGRHGSILNLSSFSLDDSVEVRANLRQDGTYLATRVKLKNNDENEIEVRGEISSKTDSSLTVNGLEFFVNDQTELRGRHNSSVSFSDFLVGSIVEVKAVVRPDSTLLATRIKQEDDLNNEVELVGTITAIDSNSFSIGDLTFFVNNQTVILGHSNQVISFSDLTLNTRVEVKAFLQTDGTLLAARVKIEDEFENEIEFKAPIDAITGDIITIGGIAFLTDSSTQFLDNNRMPISINDLLIGMLVEVRGFKKADGTFFATKIKVEDFFNDEVEITGTIDNLGADFIVVLGVQFSVDTSTVVLNNANNPINFSDLSVGMTVEIRGDKITVNQLLATKIKIEDEEDIEILGVITIKADDHFMINDAKIFIDDNTIFLNHNNQSITYSEINAEMLVEVKMVKNADGTFLALRVKIEDSPGFSKISGIVTDVSGNQITMSIPTFSLLQSTVVIDNQFSLINIASVKIGDDVTVWGNSVAPGVTEALQVQLNNSTVTGIETVNGPVNNFVLEQNYPNPFNPATTISFSIPDAQFVTLKIYNAIGQEVTTLINTILPAGSHSIQFNARNLSSGVYFYRVEAGRNVEIKKMVLMK